jgi:hypothetical protein
MSFGKRIPSGQPHLERRRSAREKIEAAGEILVPGKPPQRCLVTEYSESGARLQLSSIFGISNTFELRVFGHIYSARVLRRMPQTLFVSFR